jgi:hypothetical protein
MLESYGTGTGVAIGAACLVVPAVALFGIFFAGNPDKKVVRNTTIVLGGAGLATAATVAYFSGGLTKGSVGRGIAYGFLAGPLVLAAPAILDGIDGLVGGRLGNMTFDNHGRLLNEGV